MIYQADAILKTAVDLMIEDMRENTWLIDDVFSNFKTNPYLKKKYHTQVQDAKDWFLNNKIYVEMGYVEDSTDLPRISIVIGPQTQDANMSTMGDASAIEVRLLPNCIDKPIPYIIKPFTPASYDIGNGLVQLPTPIPNFSSIAIGQILVNISTGKGFVIEQIISSNILMISAGSNIGSGSLAVVPKFAFYEAKVEHIWENVNYSIICTAMGNAQTAIWLHDIAKYGLLRYKQGLLEALGLYESLFNSSELAQNPNFTDGGQSAWERTIQIVGKTQTTFIKAPHRLIETTVLANVSPGTPANPTPNPSPPPTAESGWLGGIQIASNSNPFTVPQEQNSLWYPIDDPEE